MEMINLNLNAINVMEILIVQEVERQLNQLEPHQADYTRPVEVATYALNRLPSLYASSQEGLNYQLQHAKQQYKHQIIIAVRQGVAAVQRDPLRRSTPLMLKKKLKSRTSPQSSTPNSKVSQVQENSHQNLKKNIEKHSKNTHAEYCRMAMKIAKM